MAKDTKKLTLEEVEKRMKELDGWEVKDTEKIYKHFSFKNFQQALDFTNKVGAVAEKNRHHPDIYLTWGKVNIEIQNHEVGNLTPADFDLAKEIDQID